LNEQLTQRFRTFIIDGNHGSIFIDWLNIKFWARRFLQSGKNPISAVTHASLAPSSAGGMICS